jgi:hypothetical protein
MPICIICEEQELKPRSQLPTCTLCRASMGVWARRRPAQVLERRRKLHIYDTRMEHVIDRSPTEEGGPPTSAKRKGKR